MPARQGKIPTPWEFLPDDDELTGEDPVSAERAAMHIQRTGHPRPARDPGGGDVDLGPAGDHGEAPVEEATYFDDEVSEIQDEEELEEEDHDLEDLLITQHYLHDEDEQEESEEAD